MERFKTTTKGYKFDKVIFWGMTLFMLLILGGLFYKYGIEFKPYVKCSSLECENPFYNKNSYDCTLAFGFIDCPIKTEEWMNRPILTMGEYGTPPPKLGWFNIMILGFILCAIGLNHLLWNKGKSFHINLLDTLEKISGKIKFEDDEK